MPQEPLRLSSSGVWAQQPAMVVGRKAHGKSQRKDIVVKEQKVIYDEDGSTVLCRAPIGSVKECAEQWFNFLFASGVDIIVYNCTNSDTHLVPICGPR